MIRTSRFRRSALSAFALVAMGAMAGCSVYQAHTGTALSEEALASAGASAAGIPVQVDGRVGGVSGAKLAGIVADSMPTEIGDAKVHYAPCAANTECPGDHVVWTFGPPAARPSSAYPPSRAYNFNWWFGAYEPAANNVTVKVAVFKGGAVVASASGQVDVDNPDDPAFKSLIESMSNRVFCEPWFIDDLL